MPKNQKQKLVLGGIIFFMITLPMIAGIQEDTTPEPAFLPCLMPVPETCIPNGGCFRLRKYLPIVWQGPESQRIFRAIKRFRHRLSKRTGMHLHPESAESSPDSLKSLIFINYQLQAKLSVGEDESYTLEIKPEKIRLLSKNDIGILHGLETLIQLVQSGNNGFFIPGLIIRDKPRFTWRGLLIDSGRHFIPVNVIKRNLDGMAAVKLNVLHWHLTEDQGFRIKCMTYPRLHELGSDGLYYTREQVKEVIAYANGLGIRVMPEFDIPGHSTSWLIGYPELASAPGPYTLQRKFGQFDPCFNPALDDTYRFFERFFAEMARLFPDEYIHIGGDEVTGRQWDSNREIQEFMKKNNIPDNRSLQAYFNRKIAKIISGLGKKMVGWEQILQPDLPADTVVQSYLGEESMLKSARLGYQTINSKADELYIDLLYPTDFHYLFDPLPENIPLTENQQKLILGSEATMWSELVSAETIDSRIWPRTAAIAERLWSPARFNDPDDMYRRLEKISLHLQDLGLRHMKVQPVILRHLTRGMDIRPLKILVDTLKPIILYERPDWQIRYTQFTPLNRLVDAALPDNPVPRDFARNIDDFLREPNPENLLKVKQQLTVWEKNHRQLKPIIDRSPHLKEAAELSENLSRIGELGLAALEFLEKNRKADQDWLESAKNLLEAMKQPRADLIIMVIPSIEKLLEKTIQ
jgi:hexosaminidase